MRMFAEGRLEERGDADDVRLRHATTYLAIAEEIAPHLPGPGQASRLDRLAEEHDNLRAALDWSITRGEVDLAQRFTGAMWRFWQGRGHIEEGWATVQRVLAMPGADARTPARLAVLDAAGGTAWWIGDIAAADRFYEEQVDLARNLGDRPGLANALFNLSHTRVVGSDPASSEAIRAEAIQVYEEIGDARGAARVNWIAANVLTVTDPAAATRMLEDLLARYVELDDGFYVAMASGTLSWSLVSTGQYEAALDHALRSFELALEAKDIGATTIGVRLVQIAFHLLGAFRSAAILEGAFEYLTNRYGISTPPAFSAHARRMWPGPEAIREELGEETYDALRGVGAAMTLDEVALLIDESVSEIRQARTGRFGAARAIDFPAMERPPARGPVVYAGEPGAFAEDAVLAAFGDVDREPSAASARSSRRSRPGRPTRPASCRSRTWSTAPSARTTTCCSSTTRRSSARSSSRSGCRLAALPGQGLDDIERVYSHIQALGQAEAFLRTRPWQLLTTYNTAGAGKSIVERGERGAAAVLSPRAAALFGLEILADDIRDVAGQPDAVPHPCAARRGDLPRVRSTAVHRGRRSPWRCATSRARCSRCSRCSPPRPEHEQARVAAEPRTRLGVRLLGRPRRGRRRPRDAGGARRTRRRHDDARVLGSYPRGDGRLIGERGRQAPARVGSRHAARRGSRSAATSSAAGPAGVLLANEHLADQPDDERDRDERDHCVEELAPADRDLCRRIAACGRLQHDLQLGEVDAAEGEPDRRHDDVVDEGGDDRRRARRR